MATVLIKHNQWFHPDIPFDDIPDNVKIVCDDVNYHFINELIAHELGPVSSNDACTGTTALNQVGMCLVVYFIYTY